MIQTRKNRIRIATDDPKLLEMFRAYCEEGWSPSSFAKFFKEGYKDFTMLRKTNEEFSKINDQYKTKHRKGF